MKHLIAVQRKLLQFLLITYTHVKFLHLIPYLFLTRLLGSLYCIRPTCWVTDANRCCNCFRLFNYMPFYNCSCSFRFKAMNSWLFITFSFSYSQKPFQYAVIFPAFPTGIARTSGAFCNWSQISNAAVFALQFDKDLLSLLT